MVQLPPPNSIEHFESLKAMFGRQFANSRSQDLTVFELSNLKQNSPQTKLRL